jgi:hypothetical protein
MPLKRLEFNTLYTVSFEAVADGKKVKQNWDFRTIKPKYTLYSITQDHTVLNVETGSTIIVYMVPSSKKDIIHSYRSLGGIKVSFLDQNTLEITFPQRHPLGKMSLEIGKKKIFFNMN